MAMVDFSRQMKPEFIDQKNIKTRSRSAIRFACNGNKNIQKH